MHQVSDGYAWAVHWEEKPVGCAGLAAYKDGYRMSTYLHPTVWGKGVNTQVKQFYVELAHAEGKSLYARIKCSNERSIGAIEKEFPAAAQLDTLDGYYEYKCL